VVHVYDEAGNVIETHEPSETFGVNRRLNLFVRTRGVKS
jgi:hypothetical protein